MLFRSGCTPTAMPPPTTVGAQALLAPLHATETYGAAAQLYRSARKKELTICKSTDCLIAAIAIEHGALLVHNDREFLALAMNWLTEIASRSASSLTFWCTKLGSRTVKARMIDSSASSGAREGRQTILPLTPSTPAPPHSPACAIRAVSGTA